MLRPLCICGLVLAVLCPATFGEDKHEHHASTVKNAGLDKMKALVGTWVTADKDGKPTDEVVSVIKLTAGGTAVQETLFPGQDHEMISMYTADGADLLMTHYCMLGNQPRMKATPKAGAKTINFEFVGGGNLDVKKDKHMHAATLTIVDKDHIEIEGIGWENGAPAKDMCNGMKLVRKP